MGHRSWSANKRFHGSHKEESILEGREVLQLYRHYSFGVARNLHYLSPLHLENQSHLHHIMKMHHMKRPEHFQLI